MKKVLLLSIVMLSFLMLILPVFAEQTVKTVEIPIGFVAQTTADTDYITTITIKPPDGVEQIISFELFVKGDFQASTDITARVRKTGNSEILSCVPSAWTTPSIDAPNYEASFDCSALAYKYDFTTGKIDVGFRTSKVAQNVKGDLKITYYNNPQGQISVFGTEYAPFENGTVFLELLDDNNNYIEDGYCELSIWNPDKFIWYNRIPMTYLGSNGLYYRDLYLPNTIGVYMLDAYCYYTEERYEFYLPYGVDWNGDLILYSQGEPVEVEYTDCVWLTTEDSQWHEYDFNQAEIGNINLSTITSIDLVWTGQSEEDFYIQAWNFSDSSWNNIGSQFTDVDFGGEECASSFGGARTISSDFADYVSGDELRFRIYLNSSGKKIATDEATVIFHNNGSVISNIRGSGEIHISGLYDLINTTLGDINISALSSFDEAKFVGATEYETGDEGKFMVQYIKTVAGSPSPENGANCTVNVTYPNGTLYLTNYQLDYLTGSNGIYEKTFTIPSTTGVYTADYYCLKAPKSVYGSDTFHVSYPINTTAISEDVWNYTERTLTTDEVVIHVSGTEYATGEEGIIWNILYKITPSGTYTPINDADCEAYIRYPNATNFIFNGTMEYITGSFGFYRYNFTVPNTTGVYIGGVLCRDATREYIETGTFHVSPWANKISSLTFDYEQMTEFVWNYSNRTVNLTAVLDLINAMNSSIYLRLDEIEQVVLDFNASIHIEVDNLANLSASEVWSYFNRTLTDYNQTELITLLNQNQNLILGMNNLSASNVWEYPIRNLTYINFTEVLDRVDLANSTIIDEILSVNASIWTKLFLIQEELAFINDTTIETNWIVKNLTLGNITLTTDINWTRLRIEVWNKSSSEKLTHDVLSFADDEVQLVISTQFCQDNTTLIHQHNVSRSILGFEYDDNFQETEICTYGCYNNECRQPPWIIYGIIFLLVLVISALIFYFSRGAEEGLRWGYK